MGVIPKKQSNEWRTIYHLSYPEGDSVNDHIPKDPYTLQYFRVDGAIRILKSLGLSQVKSSQSLFKHGKIHQEFKKLKIT